MQPFLTTRAVRWISLLALFAVVAAACTDSPRDATTTTKGNTTTTAPAATTTAPTEGDCPDAFCVKYNIRSEAAWADGTPVTADDFAFTYETIMNDQLEIASRDGYDKMSDYEVVDAKTFVAVFSESYGPWQNLFNAILPKHEMEGKPFNAYWDDLITLGSGPFIMTEWVKDERMVFERNPNYWASEDRASGRPLGDVETINIVFLENVQAGVQALEDQEIDILYPEPEGTLVEDVDAIDDIEWEAGLSLTWEHIDFNHDDPLLAQLFIRQAIATGIDRDAIVEAIVRPIAAEAQPLGNTVWLNTSSNYEDHFADYAYDPARAEAYLTDNGCTRGADAVYECSGQRLSFNWATTAGNEDRELQFVLAQASLAEIGIEINADFRPASEIFLEPFFFGDSTEWQMLNFAWVGSPDPVRFNTIYHCKGDAPSGFGELNVTRYCDDEIERVVRATDTEVDPAARADLYNQADALYLANVASIPLYQTPTFFAWRSEILGPKDNSTQIGPFWNVGSWAGMDVITYGTDEQPKSMNRFEPDGSLFAAASLITMVLEGAYTIAPDFSYVPVLITGAELTISAGS